MKSIREGHRKKYFDNESDSQRAGRLEICFAKKLHKNYKAIDYVPSTSDFLFYFYKNNKLLHTILDCINIASSE